MERRSHPVPSTEHVGWMHPHLQSFIDLAVSINGGTPLSLDGLFHGTSQSKMDENWGYPYFRNFHLLYSVYDIFFSNIAG